MLAVVATLLVCGCAPRPAGRRALGLVISGSTPEAARAGVGMLHQASAVTISQFNVQLELIGVVDDAPRVPCSTNRSDINMGLLLRSYPSFGGVHVHMVDYCAEPSKYGGFVATGDRVCPGHVALYGGRSSYITLLHELGHLLGASHPGGVADPVCSVGGIMDYCDGTYQGRVQFRPAERDKICKVLLAEPDCLYTPRHVQTHHEHSHPRVGELLAPVAVAGGLVVALAALLACSSWSGVYGVLL